MSDERAVEGLDHLQAAGRELIAAARAFLDVAEDVVSDRDAVAEVMSFVGTVASAATEAAGAARGAAVPTQAPTDPTDPITHVQHIDVS